VINNHILKSKPGIYKIWKSTHITSCFYKISGQKLNNWLVVYRVTILSVISQD